jgi:uncharacterized C2H2 Zn-finger protein
MTSSQDQILTDETTYLFSCPWCEYEFRKERYFGPHIFQYHPEKVVKEVNDE